MTFNNNEIIGFGSSETSGIGIAEEANGLVLCTEYLGFESYDMRMSENEVKNKMTCQAEEETERVERKRRKTEEENVVAPAREVKKEFPPLLSSLNGRGQRSFYLRPVRKDGRLELTQVMIDRPKIFHASRADGRLRLHLVDAYCDFEETVDLEDEPRGLNRSHFEYGQEINEDNGIRSDQVEDLSTINDDSGARSLRYKSTHHEASLNSDDDENDAREWRHVNCYKTRNHDEKDYYHHHHFHHHIHPYHHHNSNHNMHLWSRSYVKTR